MNDTITQKGGSMSTRDLSPETLHELFTIDEYGNLYWLKKPKNNKIKLGDKAGKKDPSGYVRVTIDYKPYLCHRIAYIMFNNKEIPEGMHIDHIDRNKTNNRKDNLRVVTNRENQLNRHDQAEYANMQKRPSGRYLIHFSINGKRICFGTYPLEEAIIKRDAIIADFENVCKKYEGT